MSTEQSFELLSCRKLLALYPASTSLQSAVELIENTIHSDPGVAFTFCRGLLETVCITILTDRGIDVPTVPGPNWLMTQVTRTLELAPTQLDEDASERGMSELLKGLNLIIGGLVTMRNSEGIGPHGRDALEVTLESEYAIVAARAVDTAVGLLYRLHQEQLGRDPVKGLRFDSHMNFNTYLDREYPEIVIEEAPISASLALYHQDRLAYRKGLVEFLGAPGGDEPEIVEGSTLAEHADG